MRWEGYKRVIYNETEYNVSLITILELGQSWKTTSTAKIDKGLKVIVSFNVGRTCICTCTCMY